MSNTIRIDIPHSLGQAEARRRIERGFGQFGAQLGGGGGAFSATHAWQGDHLAFGANVLGQAVTGRLDVMDQSVRIEVDLPAMLSMIAGKISGRLKRQGQILLGGR
jgi:putative polyhydroxyalkanoate system protein